MKVPVIYHAIYSSLKSRRTHTKTKMNEDRQVAKPPRLADFQAAVKARKWEDIQKIFHNVKLQGKADYYFHSVYADCLAQYHLPAETVSRRVVQFIAEMASNYPESSHEIGILYEEINDTLIKRREANYDFHKACVSFLASNTHYVYVKEELTELLQKIFHYYSPSSNEPTALLDEINEIFTQRQIPSITLEEVVNFDPSKKKKLEQNFAGGK